MQTGAAFFSEFPPVGKAEWLVQVARDLKGRDPAGLGWRLSDTLAVDPFAHADDFDRAPLPLDPGRAGWEICEDVGDSGPLEALEAGAEGLRFHLTASPSPAELDRLTEGIHRDFVGLHFAGPGLAQNPGVVLAWLERSGAAAAQRGSLAYDPAAAPGIQDWRYLAELIEYGRARFPAFTLVTVNGQDLPTDEPLATDGLATLLRRGHTYLEKLTARGLDAGMVAGQLQFSVAVGKNYFLEIARLRAFRLLWLHVLKAWSAPPAYPAMEAAFHPEAYTDDLYNNMVRATTMAMSAVLGGVQRLTVRPYDAGREHLATYLPAFGRRIARNVQHLLKMESGFETLRDPAAGSYYIEKLTRQLAGEAWKKFVNGENV